MCWSHFQCSSGCTLQLRAWVLLVAPLNVLLWKGGGGNTGNLPCAKSLMFKKKHLHVCASSVCKGRKDIPTVWPRAPEECSHGNSLWCYVRFIAIGLIHVVGEQDDHNSLQHGDLSQGHRVTVKYRCYWQTHLFSRYTVDQRLTNQQLWLETGCKDTIRKSESQTAKGQR